MKKHFYTTALSFLIVSSQLLAQNGKVFEMKFSSSMGANGSVKMYFSNLGKRSEMTISLPQLPEPMNIVNITKASNPEVSISLNETYRTYSENSLKKGNKTEIYTLEKLTDETIMEYACKHVRETSTRDGSVTEIWITKDIADYEKYKDAYNANPRGNISGLEKPLIEAGIEGFVVKHVIRGKKDGDMTMELVKIENKSIPKELFEVPAGYTKTEGLANGENRNAGANPETLTPEDRAKKREEMRAKQNGDR